MLGQSHSKKKIAAFSTTRAGFTLLTQTDPLPLAHTARNLDLIMLYLIRAGSAQGHGPHRTVQRFFQGDHNVRFHIGAAFGCRSASAKPAECGSASSSTEKCLEEIAEPGPAELELDTAAVATPLIKSAAGLLSFPLWWWLEAALPIPIGSKLIIFLPLLRVAQNLVRFVDFLEFFFGGFLVLGHIRVVLARQLAKSAANFVLARRFRHTERLVIISTLNGHLLNVVRLRSSRNSFSSTATKGHQDRGFIFGDPLPPLS